MVRYRAANTHTHTHTHTHTRSTSCTVVCNLICTLVHFVLQSRSNEAPTVKFYYRQPLSLSISKLFQHSPRSPCLEVHAYCFCGPKTIWTTFCCVLSFFHTSLFLSFSLIYSPVSPCRLYSIPLDFLRLSGCNTTELWQQSETWTEITKRGNWETADWEEVRWQWRWRPCLCHSALRTTAEATRSV